MNKHVFEAYYICTSCRPWFDWPELEYLYTQKICASPSQYEYLSNVNLHYTLKTDGTFSLLSQYSGCVTASARGLPWRLQVRSWPHLCKTCSCISNNTCYRVSNGKHWQHRYNQGTGSDRPTTHATECQTENIDSIATIKALEVTDQQHMLQSVKRKTLTASLQSRHWKWPTNNTCYRVSNGKHWQHRYNQGTGSDRPTTHATECQTENIDSVTTIKALGSDQPTTGCHRSEARKWNFQAEGGCFLFLPIHCFRQ